MQQTTMPSALKEAIALKHFGIETLETRQRDCLDFHEVSVNSIHLALEAAYEGGLKAHNSF
jgi:hypothetical protein